MRAVSLHPDVLVVTSALLRTNCVIVRGGVSEDGAAVPAAAGSVGERENARSHAETLVIDSPVLPDELDALPALLEQAGFPSPSGLLATHGDWDHLLGRLAFPGLALGVAESTAARLAAEPGAAQRELRDFDEGLYIERERPLALGSLQALPVPGRCGIGDVQMELHATDGHTSDGMALWIGWAGVLVAGDYLSSIEIPIVGDGACVGAYERTLKRLRPLVCKAMHVVPGHSPMLDGAHALTVLDQDLEYLQALADGAGDAHLPPGRSTRTQRRHHADNVERAQN
jgi:glyoxylase-like metal-dependent hydrolase (beta-lactamase superfamily II)